MAIIPRSPHISYPFRRDPTTGKVVFVEQDSEEHVMSCVNMIARCPTGYREDRPEFGWDWPDMKLMPIDPSPLLNSIAAFEPRAHGTVTEDDATQLAQAALGIQQIDVDVQVPSTDSTGVSQEND